MCCVRFAVCFLAAVSVVACSSSGGDAGATSPPVTGSAPPPPPPPPPMPIAGIDYHSGMWAGFLYGDDAVGGAIWVSALMIEDGRFRILQTPTSGSPRSSVLFRGQHELTGGLLSGAGAAFGNDGSVWLDGSAVTNFTASAAIAWPTGQSYEGGTLTGTWNTDAGDTGGFELTYNSYYNSPSELGPLVGNWSALLDADGSYPASPDWEWPFVAELDLDRLAAMTVLDDGTFSGTDAYGCEFSGQFGVIDARFRLLGVDYQISGCERDGQYSGVAWVSVYDTAWWSFGHKYSGVTINLMADDGEHVQTLEYVRRIIP